MTRLNRPRTLIMLGLAALAPALLASPASSQTPHFKELVQASGSAVISCARREASAASLSATLPKKQFQKREEARREAFVFVAGLDGPAIRRRAVEVFIAQRRCQVEVDIASREEALQLGKTAIAALERIGFRPTGRRGFAGAEFSNGTAKIMFKPLVVKQGRKYQSFLVHIKKRN